jgi:hypothetical protein
VARREQPHGATIEAARTELTAVEQDWFMDTAQRLVTRLAPAYLGDLREACQLARPLFPPTRLPALEQLITTVTARVARATATRALTPHDTDRTVGPTPRNPRPPSSTLLGVLLTVIRLVV